ncbi:MAG: tetratricopeptide repeat protein [Candidatus Limiplasma sp.]|nr:tetratricopeptide repeat protein [Candidatus Limiplasma sp.]
MNLIASLKARNAAASMSKGKSAEALKLYEEAIAAGLNEPRYILSYSVLLIREGQYQKARELLVANQKNPQLTDDSRRQLYVNYAVCVYKLGDMQKGIELLERQHEKEPSGLIYETLGYLYIEAGETEKALAFNQEAMAYDEEDAITLDNLGQVYYRLLYDHEAARTYFERAIALKPSQIDTLYFLAQLDIASGDHSAAKEKLEKALQGRFSPLNYATRDKVQEALAKLA